MTHNIVAYADDIVFIIRDKNELSCILNKLSRLKPFLSVNEEKSAILNMGDPDFINLRVFKGIPIVT